MIKINICPECGREFILPPENIYKLYRGNIICHYCSYTCYMKVKRELEEEKKARAEGFKQKRQKKKKQAQQ